MSDPTTITPTPEAPPAAETPPVPEAPPKRRPKLSPELRQLEQQLRADAPSEELKFGVCVGTPKEPHVEEVWLTHMYPTLCPACAAPQQSWPLEPNAEKD